jgi:hypothetical protein
LYCVKKFKIKKKKKKKYLSYLKLSWMIALIATFSFIMDTKLIAGTA